MKFKNYSTHTILILKMLVGKKGKKLLFCVVLEEVKVTPPNSIYVKTTSVIKVLYQKGAFILRIMTKSETSSSVNLKI